MARTGRPRSFDRKWAIEQALRLFWQHGYDATSLMQLRTGMGGISAASFYAAFGSKEMLFREVVGAYLQSYGRVTAPFADLALRPKAAIETGLRDSARMQTDRSHPSGCLIGLSPLVTGADNASLASLIADCRAQNRETIRARIAEAIEAGELKDSAIELAVLYDGLLLGLSTQARDSIPIEAMNSSISAAMILWDVHAAAPVPKRS